jgi:hypothetical protein
MIANDGGRRSGEDETVIVMRDRSTVVRGSTAKGVGRPISVCVVGSVTELPVESAVNV